MMVTLTLLRPSFSSYRVDFSSFIVLDPLKLQSHVSEWHIKVHVWVTAKTQVHYNDCIHKFIFRISVWGALESQMNFIFTLCSLDLKSTQRPMCWRCVSQETSLGGSETFHISGLIGGLYTLGVSAVWVGGPQTFPPYPCYSKEVWWALSLFHELSWGCTDWDNLLPWSLQIRFTIYSLCCSGHLFKPQKAT